MKRNNSYEKHRKKRNKKCPQPERVPGIIHVRPDTSATGETALLPELGTISIIRLQNRFCNTNLHAACGGGIFRVKNPVRLHEAKPTG